MTTGTEIEREELKEAEIVNIDFKMVTFTLGGREYGIDIMKVKEINKARKFTFVPNSAPFVKGVFNMRGDIISVIDLRIFFNLPVSNSPGDGEDMIILNLEDNTIAILVDSIDKVVGIDSSRKQPPHPLFGDINIKYIDSVVENDSNLYIILDVEKIFSPDQTSKSKDSAVDVRPAVETASANSGDGVADSSPSALAPDKLAVQRNALASREVSFDFLKDTLPAYLGFYPGAMTEEWLRQRFDQWVDEKGEEHSQLASVNEAVEFLQGFASTSTGKMWDDSMIKDITALLPDLKGNVMVWNPGCGRGHESYSLAAILKNKYPEALIKIQGNDNDLINISSAPGLILERGKIPSFYNPWLVEGNRGLQFNDVIKGSIIFEYSDLKNISSMPPLDMAVCRELLCYFPEEGQRKILDLIYESLKPEGLLLLGDFERPLVPSRWQVLEHGRLRVYKKA